MKHRRTTRHHPCLVCLGLLLLFVASPVGAAAPGVMTYTGTLLDSQGKPVTGLTTLTFRLYGQPSGGTAVWEDVLSVSPDSSGWFAAQLGATLGQPLTPALFRAPLWLGIQVASDGQEMSPRLALTAAPYAFSVDYANLVGVPASFPATWSDVSGKPATFPVDATAVQQRVSGTCGTNQCVQAIHQDGTVACGVSGTVTNVSTTGTGNPISVNNGSTSPS